jgi:hypothetical protein
MVPLRRLIEREKAETLVREFAALLPGVDFALADPDGHVVAGVGELPRSPVLSRSPDPEQREGEVEGLTILPLWVDAALVGALIAKEPAPEGVLRCLQACATMLAAQTIETRDIARETLERYREINLLYQIGETIGSCLDAAEIPGMALAEAQRAIRAEAGTVLLPASEPVLK